MMTGSEHHPQHRTSRRLAAKVSAVAWALRHDPLVEQRLETQDAIDNYPYEDQP